MKWLNFYFLLSFLFVSIGCTTNTSSLPATEPVKPVEVTPTPVKKPVPVLAWGEKRSDWSEHLLAEIDKLKWSKDIKTPCTKLAFNECLAQTISIMAKYESGFKPQTESRECKKDKCVYSVGCTFYPEYGYCRNSSQKKPVTSRGLLQISISSSNVPEYSCGTKTEDELHDPKFNLSCAVKIAHYWLNRDLVLYGEDKLGMGRYWSVMRKSSDSQAKILTYLKAY